MNHHAGDYNRVHQSIFFSKNGFVEKLHLSSILMSRLTLFITQYVLKVQA